MRLEDQRTKQLAASCCFLEVLLSLLRPPFVGSPLVCKSALLQYVRCTRVDYSNVGLDRFVSSRVEDDARLECLLGFLAAQTRVLPRRHTVQASEAHEAALQHVVPCQFLRAVDGVFDSKSGPARATALCGHVRQALSSRVRHREANVLVAEREVLRQGVRFPEQSRAFVCTTFHAGNRFFRFEFVLLDVLATSGSIMSNQFRL